MTEMVLVGCSKTKRDGIHTARDLYDESPIYRKRRQQARQRGDCWGVLSAQFGYLRPWDHVPYYNTHIDERTDIWAAFVLRDLLPDLEYHGVDTVSIFAGSKYVEPLVAPLESRGYDVVDVNRGKMPGERMQALDRMNAEAVNKKLVTDGGQDAQTTQQQYSEIQERCVIPTGRAMPVLLVSHYYATVRAFGQVAVHIKNFCALWFKRMPEVSP